MTPSQSNICMGDSLIHTCHILSSGTTQFLLTDICETMNKLEIAITDPLDGNFPL